ncbi:MAG TPA: hypothetical protein VFV79_04610 [Saprospiraceae bacterium]|nr:hypothetical protein [Saprospiraceae bacterium]
MKSNFFTHLLKQFWISLVVFFVYMLIDFLVYGLADPNAYMTTIVGKSVWSLALAITFVVVYHTSTNWRPQVYNNKFNGFKILNSVVFSFIFSIALIAAIALSHYLLTTIYVYLLDGIRGVPESGSDTVVMAGKVIVGGVVTEYCGKDQTDTPR